MPGQRPAVRIWGSSGERPRARSAAGRRTARSPAAIDVRLTRYTATHACSSHQPSDQPGQPGFHRRYAAGSTACPGHSRPRTLPGPALCARVSGRCRTGAMKDQDALGRRARHSRPSVPRDDQAGVSAETCCRFAGSDRMIVPSFASGHEGMVESALRCDRSGHRPLLEDR